jgi:hypothetical protein
MFLRIDTDLFVNVDNIFSYKLSDEGDAFKLMIWGSNGNVIHTVFYMKNIETQVALITEVVNSLKDLTLNPDRSVYYVPDRGEIVGGTANTPEEPMPTREEHRANRRIKESIPEGQLSIFDLEDKKED